MKTHAAAALLLALGATAQALPLSPRLYDVTTETAMPHLEENLRYATRHERRCLARDDLATAFWILRHEALQGCRLEPAADGDGEDTVVFALACAHGHGTTGRALWRIAPEVVHGTLDVKLGGKNMTFFQRITARPVGACPAR